MKTSHIIYCEKSDSYSMLDILRVDYSACELRWCIWNRSWWWKIWRKKINKVVLVIAPMSLWSDAAHSKCTHTADYDQVSHFLFHTTQLFLSIRVTVSQSVRLTRLRLNLWQPACSPACGMKAHWWSCVLGLLCMPAEVMLSRWTGECVCLCVCVRERVQKINEFFSLGSKKLKLSSTVSLSHLFLFVCSLILFMPSEQCLYKHKWKIHS